MLEDEDDITDPRLVSKSKETKKAELFQTNMLGQSVANGNMAELAEDIGRYWGQEYDLRGRVAVSEEEIMKCERPMNNKILKRILHILNNADERAGVLGANFTKRLGLVRSNWSNMRKYLHPVEIGSWETTSELVPNINDQILFIPVRKDRIGRHNKWACVVRLEDESCKGAPWIFIVIDPYDGYTDTARDLRKLVHKKTNLHLPESMMDQDDNINRNGRSGTKTKWHCISCPALEGCESGYRMVLSMILIIGAVDIQDIQQRFTKLKEVEELDMKTRRWILEIIQGERNILELPVWIQNIRDGHNNDEEEMDMETNSKSSFEEEINHRGNDLETPIEAFDKRESARSIGKKRPASSPIKGDNARARAPPY